MPDVAFLAFQSGVEMSCGCIGFSSYLIVRLGLQVK